MSALLVLGAVEWPAELAAASVAVGSRSVLDGELSDLAWEARCSVRRLTSVGRLPVLANFASCSLRRSASVVSDAGTAGVKVERLGEERDIGKTSSAEQNV